MKIEETTTIMVDIETHSEFHRRGVEHVHNEKNPKEIVVKVTFSEDLARELFQLDHNHRYMWWSDVEVPYFKENGEPYFNSTSMEIYPDGCDRNTPGAGIRFVSVPEKLARTVVRARDYIHGRVVRNFETAVDLDEFIRSVLERRKYFEREQELIARRMQDVEKEIARAKEELNAEYAEWRRREEQEKAAEEAYLSEMRRWIDEHGSARLKIAFAEGYRCNRRYLEERGAIELGEEYALVADANTEYYRIEVKERSCPSEEALNEVKRVREAVPSADVRVVWLPGDQRIWDDLYIAEGEEAVRVERPDLRGAVYMRLI